MNQFSLLLIALFLLLSAQQATAQDKKFGRGVGGLNWLPRDTSIDVFIELAPSLEITPSTGFAIDGAVGARFYF